MFAEKPATATAFAASDTFLKEHLAMKSALIRIRNLCGIDQPELMRRGRGAELALERFLAKVLHLAEEGLAPPTARAEIPAVEGVEHGG